MSSFKAIRSASGRRRAEDEPSVKFDDDIEDLPPLLRSLRLGHHDRVFNNEFQEDLGKHIDRLPPSPLANARHKALSRFKSIAERARKEYDFANNPVGPILTLSLTEAKPFRASLRHTKPAERDQNTLEGLDRELGLLPQFREMPRQQRLAVYQHIRYIAVNNRHVIARKGEADHWFVLVLSGTLQVRPPQESLEAVFTLWPGQHFQEHVLTTGKVNNTLNTLRALSDCELAVIECADAHAVMGAHWSKHVRIGGFPWDHLDSVRQFLATDPEHREEGDLLRVGALLTRLEWFRRLPPMMQCHVCKFLRSVELERGFTLFARGGADDSLYVLLSGRLQRADMAANLDEKTVREKRGGSTFKVHRSKSIVNAFAGLGADKRDKHGEVAGGGASRKDVLKPSAAAHKDSGAHVAANVRAAAERSGTVSILDGGTRSHKPGALEKEAMEREVGEHALLPGWVYGEHVLAAEATGPTHHRSKHLWTAVALEECEILVLDRATYTQLSTKYHDMHATSPGLAAAAQVLYPPPEERTSIHVQCVVDQLQISVPIMSRLPKAALVQAVSHTQYRLMLTDEHLALTPGDNKLYLVLDGLVLVVLKKDEQGVATETARVKPGQCLGGVAENQQDGVVRAHSAKCMELTELAVLDAEWFERLLLSELRSAMRDQFSALRGAPLLRSVEDMLLRRVAPHCLTRTLHAGTALAHAAARSDRLHFILQGQVLILLPRMPAPNEPKTKTKKQRKDLHPQAIASSTNKAGVVLGLPASRSPHAIRSKTLYKPAAHGTIQLGVLGENECFGDTSVVLGKDERETFVAASKVVLMSITKAQFNEVFGKYHDVMKNIRRSAQARVQYHEARTEKLLAFAGHQKSPPGSSQMGKKGKPRERDHEHDKSRPASLAISAQHPKPIRTGDAIPLTASLFRRLTSDIEHATEAPDNLNGDTVRLVAQSIYPLNPTRSLAGRQSRRPALRSGTISPLQKQEPAQDHIQAAAERGGIQVPRPGSRDSAYSLGGVSRTLSRQHLGSPPARALPSSRSLRASRPTSTPSGNARRPREASSSPSEPVAHDGALLGGLLEYMSHMGTGRQGSGAARSSGGGSKPVTPVTPQRGSSAGLMAAAAAESTTLVDRTHFRSPVLVIPTKDREDPGTPIIPPVGRADIINNIMDMCLHQPSTRPSVVGAFASSKPPIDQSSENQTRWIDQGGRLDVPRLDIANAIDALASGSDTLIGPCATTATSRTVHFSDQQALACTDLDPKRDTDAHEANKASSCRSSLVSNPESERNPLDHDSLEEGSDAGSPRSGSSSATREDGGSACGDATARSLQPERSTESFNHQKSASGHLSPTTLRGDAAFNQALPVESPPSLELPDKAWSPPESLKHMFLAVASSEGIETQGPSYSTTLRRQNSLSSEAPDHVLFATDKSLLGATPDTDKYASENETPGGGQTAAEERSVVGQRGKFALQSSPPVSPRSWKASGYAPTVSQFEPKIQNVDPGPDHRWSLDAARPTTSPAGSALTQSLDSGIASRPTRNATARVRGSGAGLDSSTAKSAAGRSKTGTRSSPKKHATSARSVVHSRIRPYDYLSLSDQHGHLCTSVIKDNSNAAKRMTQSGLNALVDNTTDNLLRAFRDFGKARKPTPISLYDRTKSNSAQKAEWEKTLELVVHMIPEEIGEQPEPEDPGLVCTSEFFDAYRSRHFLDLMEHVDLLSRPDTGTTLSPALVAGKPTLRAPKTVGAKSPKHSQLLDLPVCDARDDKVSSSNGVKSSPRGNWSAEEEFNWSLDRPMSAMYTPQALKQADNVGQRPMTSGNSSVERGVSEFVPGQLVSEYFSCKEQPSGPAIRTVPPVTLFCSTPVAHRN